jgi:hypothetical protein
MSSDSEKSQGGEPEDGSRNEASQNKDDEEQQSGQPEACVALIGSIRV